MLAAVLSLIAFAGPALAADLRPGDAGVKSDPTRFDPAYPDMAKWAEAGVRGGIPARETLKVVKTAKPGDDLQKLIDEAGKTDGGGVVLLSPGVYEVKQVLQLRSNVVLRGQDRAGAVLENTMRSSRLTADHFTLRMEKLSRAGIETLTLRHKEVARLGLNAYHERVAGPKNNPGGVSDLHVGGIEMERCEDCWVDAVSIVHSGSHPLEIIGGKHVTVRDTLVDGAFNKGDQGAPAGSGNVYFSVTSGLFYNNTVRNTRHALVVRDGLAGEDMKYTVVLDCNLQGDVNFHGNRPDSGHNLFEGVLVRSLTTHGWPAWAYWKKEEIGPKNLAYRSAGWGGSNGDQFVSTNPEKVYTFTGLRDPNTLVELETPAPKSGTLYATTASRPTAIDAANFPKNPTHARDAMFKRWIAP
jgi:hypothetical protein